MPDRIGKKLHLKVLSLPTTSSFASYGGKYANLRSVTEMLVTAPNAQLPA
jgi:hypothetical protein